MQLRSSSLDRNPYLLGISIMQILDYGLCQVVRLMNVFRPQGAPYIPEIAAKVLAKYQFAKPPSLDDLTKETVKFQLGKFKDVMIAEFGIYGDGVIANGKCPTEVLEDFLNDILAFARQELKTEPILTHREEVHFESILTVKSEADLAAFVAPKVMSLIGKVVAEKVGLPYQSSGLMMDCDIEATKTRRKPARVFIERKVGFNFGENIFLCIAPLRTRDHLELLTAIEWESSGSSVKS